MYIVVLRQGFNCKTLIIQLLTSFTSFLGLPYQMVTNWETLHKEISVWSSTTCLYVQISFVLLWEKVAYRFISLQYYCESFVQEIHWLHKNKFVFVLWNSSLLLFLINQRNSCVNSLELSFGLFVLSFNHSMWLNSHNCGG